MPREANDYKNLSKSLVVFSEDGYHSLYNEPYSWANITQLNFLRKNTCLMIGLSLTDPNLRRLLSIAYRGRMDKPRHFAILKRKQIEINENENIHKSIVEKFEIANMELQEKNLAEIGIKIIWIDDFDEIPQLLENIKDINLDRDRD